MRYKEGAIPMVEGKKIECQHPSFSITLTSPLKRNLTLASERPRAKPSPTPFLLCFCRKVFQPEPGDRHAVTLSRHKQFGILRSCPPATSVQPNDPVRSSPVPVEKRTSSVGAVCGNDCSYVNITDSSVTDGID